MLRLTQSLISAEPTPRPLRAFGMNTSPSQWLLSGWLGNSKSFTLAVPRSSSAADKATAVNGARCHCAPAVNRASTAGNEAHGGKVPHSSCRSLAISPIKCGWSANGSMRMLFLVCEWKWGWANRGSESGQLNPQQPRQSQKSVRQRHGESCANHGGHLQSSSGHRGTHDRPPMRQVPRR